MPLRARHPGRLLTGALLALATPLATPLGAQQVPPTRGAERAIDAFVFRMLQTMQVKDAPAIAPLVNALLSDTGTHMQAAPRRAATAADSARAREVVRTLRATFGTYTDVRVAEQAGYERFMPWLEPQAIYHYNHLGNAAAATDTFDITRPSSLLYRKDGKGALTLVGVMYTAPASLTPDELDARLPLGIAHWHQHVNFCGPMPGSTQALVSPDGPTLAKWLAIETREACRAAGGVFVPRLFGWMTHVNAFDGETEAEIWGSHGRDHMHMHHKP